MKECNYQVLMCKGRDHLPSYQELKAENEELKYKLKSEEENSNLFLKQRNAAQAENVLLREFVNDTKEAMLSQSLCIDVSALSLIGETVHYAIKALNDTPETAKLQAVLDAAETQNRFRNGGRVEYIMKCAATDKAVRDCKEAKNDQ